MPSKQRRGTGDPRWSPQRCSSTSNDSSPSVTSRPSTSTATHALLLTSLTVFLSNLLSSAHGNPLNPFAPSLSLGRNLRHLPCVVRSTGQEGICMYALNCFKANGTHLGVCIDKIFFGSCCHVHDHSLLFQHEITDNSIDHNHSTGSHFQQHFPTIDTSKPAVLTGAVLPSTDLKNVTNFQLVSSSSTTSTTTHRTTTPKLNRRNSTATATTTKIELKDEVPSTTEYQEFTTFQYVQSSKNPTLTTVEPSRRTTTKTTTRRTPPRTTTTKPTKTRKPPPPPVSRNNTRKPTVQTTTPKVIITTLPEIRRNNTNTSWSLVTRRPTTSATTTTAATTTTTKKPTTTTSTTVRRTTVINRRPTTTPAAESSEETVFPTTSRKPTTPALVPLTRPTRRKPPTVSTTTTTEEPETTRAPRPRPRPTAEITTVPATSLDHLLDDLVTTTAQDTTSAETTTAVKTTRYPTTTVKVTEPTTPTPTPTSRRTTTTTRRTTTTAAPTTTTTRQTTTTSARPTTTKTTTTTTTTQEPTTTTSTTTTTTTTKKAPTTTTSTTSTTTTTTTAAPPKTTTAAGRITPPADADYPPLETSQTENNLLDLEITAGPGLVTWTSIIDDLPSEKTSTLPSAGQAPAGPTTSNSWILIHTLTPEEVLSGTTKDSNHSSSVTNMSSSTTQSSSPPEPSASLIELALPTLLPQLLPEAAYIYTIDQETNQTGSPGDELIIHSQLASSSSLPSSTEDTTVTTTGSTTVEKVEDPSTTVAAGSTSSTASSTVEEPSTTEAVRTTSAAPSTTVVTTSSTTAEPSTTSTTVSTTSEQTTTSTSTAATEPSSSSTVTDTTTPTTTSTQFTSSVATQAQTSPSTSTTLASSTTTVAATTTTMTSTTPTTTTTTEQETSPATSTSPPEILIEILATTPATPKEPTTVEPDVTDSTTEEGSFEEGSGSEEESGEEESSSGESYETTTEPTDPTPILIDPDRFYNSTVAPLTTSTTPESTTFLTSSTLNLTSSLAEIASMFNITMTTTTTSATTTTGMPVRFPDGNVTGSTTDGVTTAGPEGTTSAIPSLEGIDYRAVCGKRMFPEPRIVGGTKAAFGRWPWQISLRQWRTSTYLHKCGAALLNENWAITAAHCVDNVPPSDLLLRLGEYDLALEEEPYGYQERRVQIVASHPQFDPRTFEYDLALLRFYEPVVFQPNIIPVCVPDNDENHIGRTAFVTGWGRLYEDGPLPSVLQEVTVPVIENKICETMYRSAGYIEHIPHIFICAGWKKGGYDSCEGDSGGPMVIQRPDKRFLLAGVISWGIGCAEPNQPGVYTRISEFRDWINQILQF